MYFFIYYFLNHISFICLYRQSCTHSFIHSFTFYLIHLSIQVPCTALSNMCCFHHVQRIASCMRHDFIERHIRLSCLRVTVLGTFYVILYYLALKWIGMDWIGPCCTSQYYETATRYYIIYHLIKSYIILYYIT